MASYEEKTSFYLIFRKSLKKITTTKPCSQLNGHRTQAAWLLEEQPHWEGTLLPTGVPATAGCELSADVLLLHLEAGMESPRAVMQTLSSGEMDHSVL